MSYHITSYHIISCHGHHSVPPGQAALKHKHKSILLKCLIYNTLHSVSSFTYSSTNTSPPSLSHQVSRIKERVEEKEGIPPVQQRLIFGGKQMSVFIPSYFPPPPDHPRSFPPYLVLCNFHSPGFASLLACSLACLIDRLND